MLSLFFPIKFVVRLSIFFFYRLLSIILLLYHICDLAGFKYSVCSSSSLLVLCLLICVYLFVHRYYLLFVLETATLHYTTLRYATLHCYATQIQQQTSVVVVEDSAFRYLTSNLCRQIRKFASASFKYPTFVEAKTTSCR